MAASSSGLTASSSLASDQRGDESVETPPLSPRSSLQRPSAATNVTRREMVHSSPCRPQQTPQGRHVVPAENDGVRAAVQTSTSPSSAPLVGGSDGKRPQSVAVPAPLTTASIPAPAAAVATLSKPPPSDPPAPSSHHQTSKPSSKSSKFRWVKSQNVEAEVQRSSRVAPPAAKTVKPFPSSTTGPESTVAASVCKKTPGKKMSQGRLPTKTSQYKWVSSTAPQPKVPRKPPSPKVPPPPHKAPEAGGIPKRVKAAPASPATNKKEVATSSRSSRYSWKAAAAGGAALRHRASFYWTPEKRSRGVRGGASPGGLRTSLSSPPLSSSSPGAFKLRSRMKIVRRSVK